jgi:type I restriction enzyme S subunit
MTDEWGEAAIEDVAEKVAMGPFGSSIKVETFVEEGVPVISGQHLHGSKVNDRVGFNFVTEEHAERLKNANVQRGDVIFTHAGNIGQVAFVPWDSQYDRYVISQRQFYMRCNTSKVLPEFIVAYFKTPVGQHQLLANTSQTGVPSIAQPVTYLRTISIPLPPLPEQRAIAHILGTLDDKIELNRRMSETLEAMARALFKSWFVDFDPVRAKAEGRDPGLPKPLADLFPARLVDSELGEIPEGWEVGPLGELVDTVKGRSYRSEELVNSDTALVTLKSFARGGGYRSDGLKSFAGTYKPEQAVTLGEVVIACTDVTQAAEVIGRPAIVRGTGGYRRLVASLDTLIVRPLDSRISRAFLYFLGGTEAFVTHTYAHTTGTTVLHLAKEAVPSFRFARPSRQLVQMFDAMAAPALDRMRAFEEEAGTLAALRDALLPKLMSGELRVKNADRLAAGIGA